MGARKQVTVKDLSKILLKLSRKDYRDGYMQGRVRAAIAYQMQALRQKFSFSQQEMATKTGKTQSVISRLENVEYGKTTIQTLLDIASALDVALIVRFASYPDFLRSTADNSESALQPDTIQESINRSLIDKFATTGNRISNSSVRYSLKDAINLNVYEKSGHIMDFDRKPASASALNALNKNLNTPAQRGLIH